MMKLLSVSSLFLGTTLLLQLLHARSVILRGATEVEHAPSNERMVSDHADHQHHRRAQFSALTKTPTKAPVNQAPTTRAPTSAPTTGPFQWGLRCFPSNGNDLRAAVKTYINEVQKLNTTQEKLQHNISKTWGYPISHWCTRLVANFNNVFYGSTSFNEPLTFWNTSSATSMAMMFRSATSFNQNLSHFDTSRVTDMTTMFLNAWSFTGEGLENFDTSRVTNSMAQMFESARSFNGNIVGWNTSRVINMRNMFYNAAKFNRDISNWDVKMVVNAQNMFRSALLFNQSLCAWGSRMANATVVSTMFLSSSCPLHSWDPDFALAPSGPFCHDCCCRPTLPSAIAGPFEVPLIPAAASNLPNGKILAWSAVQRYQFNAPGVGTYTTIFDPVTGTSTLRSVFETRHDMFCPGTSTLGDGRIVVTGGSGGASTSIYNPWNDTWAKGPSLKIPRAYHAQLTLANNSIFLLGGSWKGTIGNKDAEVYTERPAMWTRKFGIKAEGDVNTNDTSGAYRADNHMWLFEAADGRIFKAGPSRRMHWFNITGNGTVTPSVLRGDDEDAMNGNAVMFDINKIFTVGGAVNYDSGRVSNRAYVIDISGSEAVVERQGNMLKPRTMHNSVVLPNGNIVVVGGQMQVKAFADDFGVLFIEMFVPSMKRFFELQSKLKIARNYHSVALLLKDGRVAMGGGGLCGIGCDYYTPYNHPNFEILTPPYLFNNVTGNPVTSRPVILSAPSGFSPARNISVTMDTSASHTFSLIRLGSVTHTVNLDQRRVPLNIAIQVGATFTLKIPTNPMHVPPGSYWLFAMNAAGVPSIGHVMMRI